MATSRHVPSYIQRPPLSSTQEQIAIYKNQQDLAAIQKAGEIAKRVLEEACRFSAKSDVSTNDIDRFVHESIISFGAYPSPLHYHGFPKSVCTSINNVLVHGIPDDRRLKSGDIINIDVTVFYNGFHGDTSQTVEIGTVDESGKKLVNATREALRCGIEVCGPGQKFSEIGRVVSRFAKERGFNVDPHFCGHGVGKFFHMPPTIEHCENEDDTIMKEGMMFTVEPILLEGEIGYLKWPDNWTAVSEDDARSAQFEHTLLITKNGAQVVT